MCKLFGRRNIAVAALVWALVTVLASNARAGNTGSLGGDVTATETGTPIAGAKVTAAKSVSDRDVIQRRDRQIRIPLTCSRHVYPDRLERGLSVGEHFGHQRLCRPNAECCD